MADPLMPEEPGLFGSVLDWISTPGYAVRNLLRGDVLAATKNAVDGSLDLFDAILPGDWIPHLSKPEDKPQTTDLLKSWGQGEMDSGFGKFATNLVGDTLTDPLTFVPGGLVAGVGNRLAQGIGKGVKALDKVAPGSEQALKNGLLNTKSVLGWLEPGTPEARKILEDAEAAKSLYGKSALSGVQQLLPDLDEQSAKQMMSVVENTSKYTPSGFNSYLGPMYDTLLPESTTLNTPYRLGDQLLANSERALPTVPSVTPSKDYLQVKAPGEIQPIDDLSEAVGVRGVADPGGISMGAPGDKTGGLSFVHQLMDDAADATREHFPMEVTDPRFASGIDVVNQQLMAPGSGLKGIKKFGPEKETVESADATTRTTIDPLTGQPTTVPIKPRAEPEMVPASNTEALSSLQGGNPAEMVAGEARKTKPMIKLDEQLDQWNRRIDSLGVDDAQKAKLKSIAPRYLQLIHNNFLEKTKDLGAMKPGIGDDVTTMIPQDYAHRMFEGMENAADSLKGRTLKEGENLRDFMNENRGKGISLEDDLLKSKTHLGAQEGRIAQRTAIAKGLLGDEYVALADDATGGKVTEAIKAMRVADPEGAKLIESGWNGLEPRGPIMEMLSKANHVFKPAAVYGMVIPRVGGIMKNILSFPAQLALEGEGKLAGKQLLRTPMTVVEAMRKGVNKAFGLRLQGGELSQSIDLMDDAFKQGGGRAKNVTDFLRAKGREDLVAAVEHGIADGFVSREAVEDSIRNSSWGKKLLGQIGLGEKAQARFFNLVDAPAEAFQGAEQYARIGAFLDLYKHSKRPAPEAARIVRGGLYDYSIKTGGNRTLRDLIPFAAYQTNAIRQSSKFLAKNPAAAVITAEAMGDQGDDPLYPYMQGRTNIPLGGDDAGNQTYLTNLGLPFEALNSLPNPSADLLDFGRDIKRGIIGSSQPLAKSAFGVVSGEDPYFETPYGTYSKVAGQDLGGAGRAYNLAAGTGLTAPVTSQVGQFAKFFDDKGTLFSDAADFLTGANAVSVDEDRAIQQQLQAALTRNPDVQKFVTLYQNSPDPETQALLEALREAKKRVKEKSAAR